MMNDISIIYNTPHSMPLGILIAQYFYLTGLSAGSFVVSVIAILGGKEEYKPLGKIGAVLAPVCLVMAPLNLIADMWQPARFWHLFFYFNPQSPITYGSLLLTSYPISATIYAYFVYTNNQKMAKLFAIIGIPLAISVHGYTGFILALGKGRVLWNTALMPTLFLVSAMVSGIALMIIIASIRNKYMSKGWTDEEKEKDKGLIFGLGKFMAGTIVADMFLLLNDVLILFTSTQDAYHAADMLLFGKFAPKFIGVEIVLGAFIPLIILMLPKTNKKLWAVNLASLLVMIGIFAMRFSVVVGGQSLPLH